MGTSARRGSSTLAGLLRVIGLVIVAVLVVYVVLTLLDANFSNTFATYVKQGADFFSLGLSNLFLPADPKVRIALNYGLAALIWLAITTVVVRLVRRIG